MPARLLAVMLLLLSPALARLTAQGNPDWTRPFPPFRILGNIYWVGTADLSTYLITTNAGHILINTGLATTVPEIEAGIARLGFKLSDVKVLTALHGHWDHAAGLAGLKRHTGASVVMSDADAALLEDGGASDFRWASVPSSRFEPVRVDRRLKDQDTIRLGDVTLKAHHHPGHTKGATSFTLTVREGGRDYRVAIANMGGINPGVTMIGMPTYPTIAQDYARTFAAQKALPVDVFLASHASQFRLHEKYKPGDAYDPNRFVDPVGYMTAVEQLEKIYLAQLAKERGALR
jgi:metallo-beta-lactamase class B